MLWVAERRKEVKRLKKGHFRALVARKDHSDPSNQLIATSCLLGELFTLGIMYFTARLLQQTLEGSVAPQCLRWSLREFAIVTAMERTGTCEVAMEEVKTCNIVSKREEGAANK
jgi:hypothetical protein